jgi:hypothetical protein
VLQSPAVAGDDERDQRDVGRRPEQEERLAPARAHDRGGRQVRDHVAAEHGDGEEPEDRAPVRAVPGRDRVAGHHEPRPTYVSHAPSRTERSRNCRNDSSGSGLLHQRAI